MGSGAIEGKDRRQRTTLVQARTSWHGQRVGSTGKSAGWGVGGRRGDRGIGDGDRGPLRLHQRPQRFHAFAIGLAILQED